MMDKGVQFDFNVTLEYCSIKLMLITLINDYKERACFEKRLIKMRF
jgi:hypothetical protein